MDNHPAENVEDVDRNEGDQAMENCLGNSVIVRKILENFSSKKLLQISLVNKLWRSEAGSVMRKRGNLIANLTSFKRPGERCEAIEAFVSDLPFGSAPFSGIKFDNSYEQRYRASPPADLARFLDVNLDHLSLKSVSIEVVGQWQKFINYPTVLLAKQVLEQFCGVLEELELNVTLKPGDFIDKVVGDCKFQRLKILKVTNWTSNGDEEKNNMKALLSRAPNLKFLHTDMNIDSALQLLQGTSVGFVYTMPARAPFVQISENVINAITLENMELIYTGPGFNLERFNRIAPMLLQASCTTSLREMTVDAVLAVSLMCFGIPLENVKYIQMETYFSRLEYIEPRILRILKDFDFTRIFPNLDQVYIVNKYRSVVELLPDHMNAIIEHANAVLREPKLDRAARVKKLRLIHWDGSSAAAQFYVEMFPNIKKLEVVTSANAPPIPFRSIWNWLDLKKIEIRGNLLPDTGNLDSVFCGIFPEEVAELRLQDDEYLKKVNIVPIMPAVTCLKNLRTMYLHHEQLANEQFKDDDETLVFSKVTALLAFARLPALTVSLTICTDEAPREMDHLKPYVSVTFELSKH